MNIISNIPFDIYPTLKDNYESVIVVNKYISGSFNLTKNISQSQKYYINDDEYNKLIPNQNYIIEFSSNYENIEITFNNSKIEEYKNTTKYGGIQQYFIFVDSTEINDNFFVVWLKNDINYINDKNDNYLNEAHYILNYYRLIDKQIINNLLNFSHNLIPNNNNSETFTYALKIKNNIDNKNLIDNYEFTCILNIT